MGVRNELVQSVGKGQVHADSLSLAPSPFPFPPQLQSTPPSLPPSLPASRVQRQSGERLLFLLLLNIQLEKLGRFFFVVFFPSCAAI